MFSLALISLLIAQSIPCSGLTSTDTEEIRQISQRILGENYPIMFVIFGEVPLLESHPVVLFCKGSDDSRFEDNPDYQNIELDNKEVQLYLKVK